MTKLSTLSPKFLYWMVIANIEPTVEKYIIEAAFKFFFLKCFTLHLLTLIFAYYFIGQALSILRFFGNFTVRSL